MAIFEGLTRRQSRFIDEYLLDRNGKKAAIRAGYKPAGAECQASRMLRNVKVETAVKKAIAEQQKRTQVTTDKVLAALWEVANSDFLDIYQKDGTLKSIHEMPEETRRAIASIEIKECGTNEDGGSKPSKTMKVRFWDKLRALEMLGRHLKMFSDKIEISHTGGFAEKLKLARERQKES